MNIKDKIICIDDTGIRKDWFPDGQIVLGQVYVVRAVVVGIHGAKGVYLAGIYGSLNQAGIERGWYAHRFKPFYEFMLEQMMDNVEVTSCLSSQL